MRDNRVRDYSPRRPGTTPPCGFTTESNISPITSRFKALDWTFYRLSDKMSRTGKKTAAADVWRTRSSVSFQHVALLRSPEVN